jgi:hypothetical protein
MWKCSPGRNKKTRVRIPPGVERRNKGIGNKNIFLNECGSEYV